MNTFGGDSALLASSSIPRRLLLLLLEEGRSNPGRLLSQDGSIPGASWEGTDRELGVPVPPSSQAPPYVDTNLLIILAALVCALISAVSFFSMMRCALQCSRGAFRTPEAAATRRCNTAMKKAAINALPTLIYRKQMQPPEAEAAPDCPICLAEFEDGEKLRALLQCNHCFHMECIDRWFRSHSSCPTCRNCVVAQAKPKAATPSNNSQAFQVCESSAIQIPRAECAVEVVDHVGRPARHGESFKDDRPGAGCWKSGKPLCDAACGIGR